MIHKIIRGSTVNPLIRQNLYKRTYHSKRNELSHTENLQKSLTHAILLTDIRKYNL